MKRAQNMHSFVNAKTIKLDDQKMCTMQTVYGEFGCKVIVGAFYLKLQPSSEMKKNGSYQKREKGSLTTWIHQEPQELFHTPHRALNEQRNKCTEFVQ